MRVIFFLLLTIIQLFSMTMNEKVWKKEDSLEQFLKEHHVPLSVLSSLSSQEQLLARSISQGSKAIIILDKQKLYQAIIPANNNYQVFLSYTNNSYALRILPITFQIQKKILSVSITSNFLENIYQTSENPKLGKVIESIFSGKFDTNRLKNGDKITIAYSQKIRAGKPLGIPDVTGVIINTPDKTLTAFRYEKDNKYYDEKGLSLKEEFVFAPSPVRNVRITSYFSFGRYHPVLHYVRPHYGVDYGGGYRTPIYAIANGVISLTGNKGDGYGIQVQIRHKYGYESQYAHLAGIASGITNGLVVKKGQLIGYMGSTGLSSGIHLHFGIFRYNKPLNPLIELRRYIEEEMDENEKRTFLADVSQLKQKMLTEISKPPLPLKK